MVAKADIPGLPRFMRQLADIARDVDQAIPESYLRPLSVTVSTAQSRAPRLTGKLANSIQQGRDGDGSYIYADAPHAAITEKGGSHPVWGRHPMIRVSPRPFLRPSIEEHSDDFMRANKEAVMKAARKAGFR